MVKNEVDGRTLNSALLAECRKHGYDGSDNDPLEATNWLGRRLERLRDLERALDTIGRRP